MSVLVELIRKSEIVESVMMLLIKCTRNKTGNSTEFTTIPMCVCVCVSDKQIKFEKFEIRWRNVVT